ncbi:MAG: hypothetical protein ACRDQ5_24470 [Sciscionella sp.]
MPPYVKHRLLQLSVVAVIGLVVIIVTVLIHPANMRDIIGGVAAGLALALVINIVSIIGRSGSDD